MKIVLLGYMGSGKSTITKKLSQKINLPYIDLDKYIETKENKSIEQIFRQDGEIFFRLIEHKYLKELLQKNESFILALGGGTPCYSNNMDFILNSANTISVYLQTNVPVLADRLKRNKSKRPLIANLNDNDLLEFTAKHLFERSFFYEQAHKKIICGTKNAEDITAELQIMFWNFI